MKAVTLEKVYVISFAKIYGIGGLITGLILGIIALIIRLATQFPNPILERYGLFGGMLVYVISYGVIGFVTGIIGSFIYNILAKKVGGIKIDLK